MTLRCPFCGEDCENQGYLEYHLDHGHTGQSAWKLAEMIAEKQPKRIGPTEADNWEYNGERWVKKK